LARALGRKEDWSKSGHIRAVLSSGHITAGPLLESGYFSVFGLILEVVQVWMSPRLERVGSLRGEPSCEALWIIDGFLAKMERRAATRTRAERKMAAVREEAAMEGKLRARVMPRVSRGRASTHEERHRRRLRGKAASDAFGSDVSGGDEGGKPLADFPGERKTLSSRSMGRTLSSLTELPLLIGEREQLEGRQRVLPGRMLEHLSMFRFSGPYNIEQNSKSGFLD